MKDIKLSFPYPSTSRHNLSQDIALSCSMGLVIPARIVEVLPGDSHRIGTSFSLVSNPLVKPLLQGVRLRYCRFWVPRRIYNSQMRANNADFDPMHMPVRSGTLSHLFFPAASGTPVASNFQASSLFDYLGLASIESNSIFVGHPQDDSSVTDDLLPGFHPFPSDAAYPLRISYVNVEPYIAYMDICRNYFSDSAANFCAFVGLTDVQSEIPRFCTVVGTLTSLDSYIDRIQNSDPLSAVIPFDFTLTKTDLENPQSRSSFAIESGTFSTFDLLDHFVQGDGTFRCDYFGLHHFGLCVPLNRPDRLSRLFDTRPLTSQNAVVSPSEISISNLSFLAKLQRYLTRKFFGGSRFTDVMYSVFGQKVPHVDSPVLLDVFDQEIGTELVPSTNATETTNPGVLGGYFSSAGVLSTEGGRTKKRYSFNESGYLIDLFYIMPRLFRAAFTPDFYFLDRNEPVMSQANFVPDFNGIGWQQPAFGTTFFQIAKISNDNADSSYENDGILGFSCEPSWQQYRTLPDVCHGLMNPLRGIPNSSSSPVSSIGTSLNVSTPLFTFNDRMSTFSFYNASYDDFTDQSVADELFPRQILARQFYTSFNDLNRIFGTSELNFDNIFVVFRYAHQAKRQVTKRFTLNF